jgi:hypothetical protein
VIVTAKNLADAPGGRASRLTFVSLGDVVDAAARSVEGSRAGESSPEPIASLVAYLASQIGWGSPVRRSQSGIACGRGTAPVLVVEE